MALITINDFDSEGTELEKSQKFCKQLEEGNILYFPQTPFDFPQEHLDFLLDQRQSRAAYHKNIAYRPGQDRITGVASQSEQDKERFLGIMRDYSRRVTTFATILLAPYGEAWRLDYASFRSKQEEGREIRLRARNDLLHVDSFPTRPTNGDRILRLFTNINPAQPRRWITTDSFDVLVKHFAGSQLPLLTSLQESAWHRLRHTLARAARSVGLPVVPRSLYDDFMLRFHHFLKENDDFQANCPKQTWEFAPGSTWLVFTDLVPHAVLAGQYALEQTYIVSRHSLVSPHKAPVSILEELCGAPLC